MAITNDDVLIKFGGECGAFSCGSYKGQNPIAALMAMAIITDGSQSFGVTKNVDYLGGQQVAAASGFSKGGFGGIE